MPRTTGEKRDCGISFRVTKTERQILEKAAKKARKGISCYCKEAAVQIAEGKTC